MFFPLTVNVVISVCSCVITNRLIPGLTDMFLAANLSGIDMSKKNRRKIPEAMGVVTGCVFLVILFLFIPFPFSNSWLQDEKFPHDEFVELISAMLSICCMILLGFADDVLNLRWRHKLLLPTVASLPLLMVYFVNFNSTTVIMPKLVRDLVGYSLDIGFFYYIFMGMLAVFCTNAINILAGVNGLEVGQSLVIAASVIIFNGSELWRGASPRAHLFSLYFMIPYLATSVVLWQHNKYPSKVFVGDTFCYLSGMTFAVVGILGHFSKTLLLFFLPQIFNFLYSVPQLFHFIPCPRHRMPKYNKEIDRLEASETQFRIAELNIFGRLFYRLFKMLRLIKTEEKNGVVRANNFTLINLIIIVFGPTHEKRLTEILIGIQIVFSCVAFAIRYPMARYFYDV